MSLANSGRDRGRSEPFPKIPGYTIEGELGRGGMSIVYKAIDRKNSRVVAIKRVTEREMSSPVLRRRFEQEGDLISRLNHPNIVYLYDYGESEGLLHQVLEFVAGGTLLQKLKSEPLKPSEVLKLFCKIAAGMAAVHDLGITHRDLKPGNILLAPNGEPKIADFGLARQEDSNMTVSGKLVGTPSYMAPEQAQGQRELVGPHTDVWAIGVMLYECLTHESLFRDSSTWGTIKNVLDKPIADIRTVCPQTPPCLAAIIMRCLQRDLKKRYPSARELSEALTVCQRNITARPNSKINPKPVRPKSRPTEPVKSVISRGERASPALPYWNSQRVGWAVAGLFALIFLLATLILILFPVR